MTAQENTYYDDHVRESNIKTLLSWHSPARPWKKRGKQFYILAFSIAAILAFILFLFSEYMLMVTTFALTFVALVLASTSPGNVFHRVSNQGVTIGEKMFLWKELYDFYFKKQFGEDVLHIRTQTLFPGEIVITLGPVTKEHVRDCLIHHLSFRESMERSFVEKSGDWLARTFPLENTPQ